MLDSTRALGLLDVLREWLVVARAPEERERSDGAQLAPDERDEHAAGDQLGVRWLAVSAVAVRHGDRPGERARDSRGRRLGGLLRSHSAGRNGGRGAMPFDDHHRGVESGDLHRGVQDAVHQLLEVDRAAELAEEPVAPILPLRSLQRLREVVGELVHLQAHLVDRAHEALVRLRSGRRGASYHDERQRRRYDHEGRHDGDHHGCRHTTDLSSPCTALLVVTRSGEAKPLERGTPTALYSENWTLPVQSRAVAR